MAIFFTICGLLAVVGGGFASFLQYQAFRKTLDSKGPWGDLAMDTGIFLVCAAGIVCGLRTLAVTWFGA